MRISHGFRGFVLLALLSGLVSCGDGGVKPYPDGTQRLPGTFYLDRTAATYSRVHAFSPDHMFVIGEDDFVIEIDGNERVLMRTGSDADLLDIWASSPTDVYVVGAKPGGGGGEILRYNGRWWKSMPNPLEGAVNGVFGSGYGDVYAVTGQGEIARLHRKKWEVVHTADTVLTGGWASGPGDVHVVGSGGLYVRYDGSSWESMTWATWSADAVIGVRGVGATGAWLFGRYAVVSVDSMQIDGMIYWDNAGGHNAVASNDPGDLYIVGDRGRLVRYDGADWNEFRIETPRGYLEPDLLDVSMTGPSRAVAVGPQAAVVDIDGYTTSLTQSVDPAQWTTMAGTGNLVLAPRHILSFLVNDGTGWRDFDPPLPQDVYGSVYCAWAASPDEIWAVVNGIPFFVAYYDGSGWNIQFESGDIAVSIWGAATDDIFIAGYDGKIWHYDGSAWTLMADTGYKRVLQDMWGSGGDDVYIVGANTTAGREGAVLHYDGSAWSADSTYFEHDLYGVSGTSSSDVVVVGIDGAIYRFDGTAWNLEPSGTTNGLRRVWAGAPDNYWAVGVGGTVAHYDGVSWQIVDLGLESMLWSVWGTESGDVFIGGFDDTILRYSPRG